MDSKGIESEKDRYIIRQIRERMTTPILDLKLQHCNFGNQLAIAVSVARYAVRGPMPRSNEEVNEFIEITAEVLNERVAQGYHTKEIEHYGERGTYAFEGFELPEQPDDL